MGVSHFVDLMDLSTAQVRDELHKAQDAYISQEMDTALIAVNPVMISSYNQEFLKYPICYIQARLKEESFSRLIAIPQPKPCLIYLGPYALKFHDTFRRFGEVVLPLTRK